MDNPHNTTGEAEARDRRRSAPEKFRQEPRERSRLPDGARFEVTYNAENARWSGTLVVGARTVKGEAGGVMTLLGILDEKYRVRVSRRGGDNEDKHVGNGGLACPACGTDSTVGCLKGATDG